MAYHAGAAPRRPRRARALLLPWGCWAACLSLLPQSPSLPAAGLCAGSGRRRAAPYERAMLLPRHQRLRGGNEGETFGQDVEGGNVESALADPEMTKVRAFMPRELRRDMSFDGLKFDILKERLMSTCWFYPLPPWGRKDVFQGESRSLQVLACLPAQQGVYLSSVCVGVCECV